ncbi:type VII secretion protein EccCa [Mycolicibacterium litorale]|uniref:Type VII secretion protein EccC n=1 Tax=Mycolicibacterium litorale TaxID=758802 RepID=A0AAD1MVI9_9MYCO|nr:type VII secretion protein EccCa [Mycolicibacterium litorale]MCV7416259.1 type VII secretion protein EccCa [Mycolicibacterium litorale]TDY09511.1 S-DNA-T family DNA segregation ATPase FtsK/SpoIIIE [Mycolicibacterium litorale]BBY17457.1 type VII secretion protein EccC [Mycolicibacterium litorale]
MDITERLARTGEFVLQTPPAVPRQAGGHPLARLMPFAMLIAAGGMMLLYFTSGAGQARSPMFGFFPVMMVMSLVGTLVFGARGTQRGAEVDRNRRDYLRYLDGVDRAVAGTARGQYDDEHHTHPDPHTLWVIAGGGRMWERSPQHAEFGCVRIGLGQAPTSVQLVAPQAAGNDDVDPVTAEAARALVRDRSTVDGLPLTVNLLVPGLICFSGDPAAVRNLVRAALCQLATLHGPDDVTVRAVGGAWDWLKWIPHQRSSGAHLVLIADGAPLPAPSPAVTVLCLGAAEDGDTTVHVERGEVVIRDRAGDERVGKPDGLTREQTVVCARRLAARAGVDEAPARTAPRNWQDLLGIGDPASVDPAAVWRPRAPAQFLRVPIGLSDNGIPVELDLKEAAEHGMGPHGLCVGATGSGKSELLRTLTLGLIASHPPDTLNLILVDFKGGATFLGLDRTAHVSAVITNLEEEAHLVSRMRDALAGEMHRRQQLLRSAGNIANIAGYRKARSSRPDLPALPVLLIVVDEFSELLTQHPDFAELFLAIGRVGRSLGMHLLLASQRLDEGRLRGLDTHLSYRICLKTFSAGESRAVLGVADAHDLPNTPGVGYLKTASGELTRFRTAFVSGPVTAARGAPDNAPRPRLFTTAAGEPHEKTSSATGSMSSLLDAVVDRLAGHGTPAHRVWLPPLSDPPTLDAVLSRAPTDQAAPLSVPIGLVDCPFEQRRELYAVGLGGAAGNVAVVGGPRAGKSTALRTLMLALAATNDPRDVQFYCLDLGGGALAAMADLPHTGVVAGRQDADLLRRIVAECESLVRAREQRFRRDGIESIADYRRRRAAGDPVAGGDPYGEVFLVVDGWAVLRRDFEQLEPSITALAVQGLSYGVHVVLTASRWADLRPALKDQLGTRIELRLGDPAESEMDRKRARQLTDGPPGRGLTRDGRETVIALPRLDGHRSADGLGAALTAAAGTLRIRYGHRSAPPIAALPALVRRHDIAGAQSATRVLIGLGEAERTAVAVDFAAQQHLIVLGDVECGKTAVLRTLCAGLIASNPPDAVQLLLVDFRRTLLGVVESDHLAGYVMAESGLATAVPALIERLAARMPGAGVTQQQLRTRSWWSGPELYVVIDDYDLVAGGAGLTPLLGYLPHARDVGMHVIVARRSGGAARAMFDPLLGRLRDLGAMGLMMSAGPDEGVLLGSVRPTPLPPGRATLVTRGAPDQLIQVAWTEPP